MIVMPTTLWKKETLIDRKNEAHYEKSDMSKRFLVDMLDESGVLDRLLEGKHILLSAYHTRSFAAPDMTYIHRYGMRVTEVDKRFGEFLEDGGTINFGPPDTVRPRGL